MSPTPALKPAEAAAELALSRNTVYRLIATGKLPASVVNGSTKSGGARYAIRRADLDRYLAANATT